MNKKSTWNLETNDKLVLYNTDLKQFIGLPKTQWSFSFNQDRWMFPFVIHSEDVCIFQFQWIPNTDTFSLTIEETQTGITGMDTVSQLVNENIDRLYLSNEPTKWVCYPITNVESKNPLDRTAIYYGMEMYIQNHTQTFYMSVDRLSQWVAQSQTRTPWLFMPATHLYSCLDPTSQICHHLTGTAITHAQMRCTKKSPLHSVECHDDEGHPVFKTSQECKTACQTLRYTCSGDPHYQCKLAYNTPDKQQFTNYDDCRIACQPNVSKQQSYSLKNKSRNTIYIYVLIGIVVFLCCIIIISFYQFPNISKTRQYR